MPNIVNTNNGSGMIIGGDANQKVAFHGKTPIVQSATYTVTNPTTDRALNVTVDTLAQGLAVLGTLISDLKDKGIIG